jgi:hypothetical protein
MAYMHETISCGRPLKEIPLWARTSKVDSLLVDIIVLPKTENFFFD